MRKYVIWIIMPAALICQALHAEESAKDKALVSIPEVFVPDSKPMKGESEYSGASFMELIPNGPPGPGTLWMMAHSGVGNTFPVNEPATGKLFDVKVEKGDNDQLEIEIDFKGVKTKLHLKHGTPVTTTLDGAKWEFYFPVCFVAGVVGEKRTTPKAQINVTRLKQ